MWTCPSCERSFKRKNQPHSCIAVHSVDDYIDQFPETGQARLQELRTLIRQAAPNAMEKISWNMPTYVQNGNIVHFAMQQKHIGLHVGVAAVKAFEDELANFNYAKGTIHLPHAQPLPKELIQKIVHFNIDLKLNQ
ncbi:iron chaperone [Sporosarcina pasteurii]|uniref:Uncharacterized conserved protein n=1 Tax=Sporosarcina pasteurii TaxID=1474 RepID=A0A380BYF9_SPOPA|nr:DUF1801 domain-containing protein [Sporosarcina pasteurii]MDS9471377.1 DUF1801 domain-containing protein [Sporosarcina pasteurii]QBQ04995.1 hypothetical protein E2C16_04615 [Sporosarcina pasteurii]SUJ08209.1 Uncharacterized conserved protein [Sporosarcina pasteurii]